MSKKYPCEKCGTQLTGSSLYFLQKTDFCYHRYCKDCIRPEIKALALEFKEEDRKYILFDEPRNGQHLHQALQIIDLNITNLIFKKIHEEPEFAKKYKEMQDKLMKSLEEEAAKKQKKL